MNWNTIVSFTLEGAKGDLVLHYNPFGQKLYQDGTLMKGKGGIGGYKYPIETTEGGTDKLTLKTHIKQGRVAEFKGYKKNLETSLTTTELAICFIPLLIFALGCSLFIVMGGVIGGLLLGLAIGIIFTLMGSFIRNKEGNTGAQIGLALGVGVLSYGIYFILAFIFSLIFGAAVLGAMSAFELH